ncbi:PTS sugar transporter subunit IIA [Actinomadura sp. KC345]|uniref:PTS sugar transporter subunit IIA n=1 Tax=Actinomadura sp. KC345 TaxID=2530371 RepID=UPI00104E6CAD|nr:PTS sugar transporter subunit IIA [Actinomadura sp. KC345]TDC53663.1 PTS sugar transporter subunit IIA [Actinomadura sp. KC345]
MTANPGEISLLDALPEEAVAVGVAAGDWRAAIRAAGDLLVATGAATPAYGDEMIQTVVEHGPYIVLAPGLALAHSRPSPSVLRTGLSWAGLAAPVEFGSKANDPVRLVIGLAAVDHDAHSGALARLARMLADADRMRALHEATSAAGIRRIISEYEGSTQ